MNAKQIGLVACILVACPSATSWAASVSSTWANPSGGNWFGVTNWTGSVPDGTGHVATFGPDYPVTSRTITLDGPVTVGEINVSIPRSLSIVGSSGITLDAEGGAPAVLRVHPQSGPLTIVPGISVAAGDSVVADAGSGATMTWYGVFSGGSAELRKTGDGALRLYGNNSAWTGPLDVEAGAVEVKHAWALGASSAGTTVRTGGELRLAVASLTAEPIALDGGTLAGPANGHATVAGPIELLASSRIYAGSTTSELTVTGAIAGPGGVTFDGGEVLVTAANSYTGPTVINSGTVYLTSATGLGSGTGLDADGTTVRRDATLAFGGGLTIANEKIRLDGGTFYSGHSSRRTLNGPIELLSDSTVNTTKLTLAGTISGPGGMRLSGSSLRLEGHNDYLGETVVTSGDVRAYTGDALGSPLAGTTITGGALSVDELTTEPFHVAGGELRLSTVAPGYPHSIRMSGGKLKIASDQECSTPVVLEPGSSTIASTSEYTSSLFTGGVTGSGDLSLFNVTVDGAPLAHDGSLTLDDVTLNAANSYTGPTIVRGGTTVNHAGAFGTSDQAILIGEYAGVTLNEIPDKDFELAAGTLRFHNATTPYTGTITIIDGRISGNGIIDGDVVLQGPSYANISGGTFNGTISGAARLLMYGDSDSVVNLNGANSFTGPAHAVEGTVNVNHAQALGATAATVLSRATVNVNVATDEPLIVYGGTLNLNVQLPHCPLTYPHARPDEWPRTIALNVPSHYDDGAEIISTRLFVNENSVLDHLIVRGEYATVEVAPGKTLSVTSSEIELREGTLAGAFAGVDRIRKTSSATAWLERLDGFGGEIVVERGILRVTDDGLGTTAKIVVASPANATVWLHRSAVVEGPIQLNNATGIDHKGGLYAYSSGGHATLRGALELGDVGSIIGGQATDLTIEGPVSGGSLIKTGNHLFHLGLKNGANDYTGVTDIRRGSIYLAEAGRIGASSRVVIHPDARLILYNSEPTHTDRLADAIPVELRGGLFRLSGPTSGPQTGTETVGDVIVAQGHSTVELSGNSRLTLNSLTRDPGATVYFKASGGQQILVNSPPPLTNGIIGGWATARSTESPIGMRFATCGPDGIQPLATFVTDLPGATPDDNVVITSSLPLSAPKKIHSLQVEKRSEVIDLGGHELHVVSGGVLAWGTTFRNGTLTAGGDGPGELLIHGGAYIEADITDNGPYPVSVVLEYNISLRGNNSYSGSTTVNYRAEVSVDSASALPEGTDLILNGGELAGDYTTAEPQRLGTLSLRAGGWLWPKAILDFDFLDLQDGDMGGGGLAGDGTMEKTTAGTVLLESDNPDYHGTVIVYDGVLDMRRSNCLGTAHIELRGGVLLSGHSASKLEISNDLTLAGGLISIHGSEVLSGTLNVAAESAILAPGAALTGPVQGNAPLHLDAADGTISLSGDNSGFTGGFVFDDGGFAVRGTKSLGSGLLTLNRGASLRFYKDYSAPSTYVENPLLLNGGEVFATAQDTTFAGDITVAADSCIGIVHDEYDLVLSGDVRLMDRTRLTKRFDPDDVTRDYQTPLEITGRLLVGKNTELLAVEGFVRILGPIVADASGASLDLIEYGCQPMVLGESIEVATGRSLTVRRNSAATTLEIDAPGQFVAGGGTLHNELVLSGEAVLRPGDSTGTFTDTENVTFGAGGVYEWEIGNALGTAGSEDGWDLLVVDQTLLVTATPADPFVIDLIGLDGTGQPGVVPNFNPQRTYDWIIASAETISGFDPATFEIDASDFLDHNPIAPTGQFLISHQSGDLVLSYVPEPSTLLLLSMGAVGLLVYTWRRRRR